MDPTVNRLTTSERAILQPFFSDLDGPVFALTNLPEVVKGALFARYSRSPKTLRRLFLDEFADISSAPRAGMTGSRRSEQLYEKVLVEYGDDSVAQLGGVHLACEGVSNLATKVLEWGRLGAYLEQSTRYIPYTDRPGGRWRYHTPAELADHPVLARKYEQTLDAAFATYAGLLEPMKTYLQETLPCPDGISASAHRRAISARALDIARGLLPAATSSNVGIYASGQAFESLLLRMRADPLDEITTLAARMLSQLRLVIPAFLTRVDMPERGAVTSAYLAATREATASAARRLLPPAPTPLREEVRLTDFDPDGELKVVAAALYASTTLPDDELLASVRRMTVQERAAILAAYCGERSNRRHKPGRAFERTAYRFDVLADYGAFRDLQRHRMLTLEWQRLSPAHGYGTPPEIAAGGFLPEWQKVMDDCAGLFEMIAAEGLPEVAPYAVPMAYKVRFYIHMNAREAMHLLELRTSPQGHPSYRRVCQKMHRLIAETAGHAGIAGAMRFVDHSEVYLERLAAEQALELRRDRADL